MVMSPAGQELPPRTPKAVHRCLGVVGTDLDIAGLSSPRLCLSLAVSPGTGG